jgi:hypothetical protein
MRTVRRTRCRRQLAVCSLLVALALCGVATASAAPYVSCPGGYIADNLGDCPDLPVHPVGGSHTGGGGGGGGLLGDLLGGLGLGGLF